MPAHDGELAERLKVSRGSIGADCRLLESIGVIKRAARPGDRQDSAPPKARPA
jgi:DNA-binding transcriptional regulator GbsR (MarR family)